MHVRHILVSSTKRRRRNSHRRRVSESSDVSRAQCPAAPFHVLTSLGRNVVHTPRAWFVRVGARARDSNSSAEERETARPRRWNQTFYQQFTHHDRRMRANRDARDKDETYRSPAPRAVVSPARGALDARWKPRSVLDDWIPRALSTVRRRGEWTNGETIYVSEQCFTCKINDNLCDRAYLCAGIAIWT